LAGVVCFFLDLQHLQHLKLEQIFDLDLLGDLDLFKLELDCVLFGLQQFLHLQHFKLEHIPDFLVEFVFLI
jgi:hypothetical protein